MWRTKHNYQFNFTEYLALALFIIASAIHAQIDNEKNQNEITVIPGHPHPITSDVPPGISPEIEGAGTEIKRMQNPAPSFQEIATDHQQQQKMASEGIPMHFQTIELQSTRTTDESSNTSAIHSDTTSWDLAGKCSKDLNLKLSSHMYSTVQGKSSILINDLKLSEGATLPDGFTLKQITPQGIVLEKDGTLCEIKLMR